MGDKKTYATKQRNSILNFFKAYPSECFSARQIIDRGDFHIGEATVYRLLVRLTDEGMLKRFISDKGSGATYQYNETEQCGGHFHLKCLQCGETACMDCSFIRDMEKHVEAEHEFLMDNTKTILYGVCKGCKNLFQNDLGEVIK